MNSKHGLLSEQEKVDILANIIDSLSKSKNNEAQKVFKRWLFAGKSHEFIVNTIFIEQKRKDI